MITGPKYCALIVRAVVKKKIGGERKCRCFQTVGGEVFFVVVNVFVGFIYKPVYCSLGAAKGDRRSFPRALLPKEIDEGLPCKGGGGSHMRK